MFSKHTTATARNTLRAAGLPAADTQTGTKSTLLTQPRVTCALLTEYSVVPLGLWNDMRLPSFFSGVFFWPVSESKRGKVRITFMFLSPQLVTGCCFPALWIDSSFVNSEQASQPTIWAVSAGPLPLSPSLTLTRCACSLSITPSLLALSLSLYSFSSPTMWSSDSRWNPPPGSPRLAPSFEYSGRERESRLTSIRALPRWRCTREEEKKEQESGGYSRGRMEERGQLRETLGRKGKR